MEKILVYTSSTCPHCKTAKKYLDQKNYNYIERNVQTDPSASSELQALGAQGVPTFKIGEQVIVGFNPSAIEKAVSTKVMSCPNCQKKLSVPKGKGKIKITCPHCGHKFTTES